MNAVTLTDHCTCNSNLTLINYCFCVDWSITRESTSPVCATYPSYCEYWQISALFCNYFR